MGLKIGEDAAFAIGDDKVWSEEKGGRYEEKENKIKQQLEDLGVYSDVYSGARSESVRDFKEGRTNFSNLLGALLGFIEAGDQQNYTSGYDLVGQPSLVGQPNAHQQHMKMLIEFFESSERRRLRRRLLM